MQTMTDSERAFALWEQVNGLTSRIEVHWPVGYEEADPEYIVRIECPDTTVDIDELENFVKIAREHQVRHVFVEGSAVVMIL